MNQYNHPFPSTQWTRLEQEGATAEGREWFCEIYRPAVLQYLRTKMEHHEAEDLCQEFFARVVLDGDLPRKAERSRGSLRGLLLKALGNFIGNHRRYGLAQKRGGGVVHQSLDSDSAGIAIEEDHSVVVPDRAFDRAWAAALLERALEATERDCRNRDKEALFAALKPLLDGSGPSRPHAQVAQQLGLKARDVTVALNRLRQRVAKHLYAEVAMTVCGSGSVAEEWEFVKQALNER